ncbi:MAG: cache domain-containing protein, partial [Alphaproteobacteria bacterium]
MRLSLRWTLILYLAGLQLLAVGAILAPSYVNSERTLLDHARRLMRDVAFNTIAHANQFLAPAESAAELSKRLAENEIVARDDPDLLEKLLYEQLKLTPQFAGIYYGDERGDFVYVMRAAKDAPAQFRTKLMRRAGDGVDTRYVWRDGDFRAVETRADPADRYDPRERPWYVGAKAKGVTTWTDPYIFYSSRNPGVTVASPIFDSAGKLNGVVGVDIEIGAISDFLARLKIGEHGVARIRNHNGDVIAHPKPELIKTEKSDGSGGMRFTKIGEIADPIARSAFAPLVVDGAVAVSSKEMAFDERGVARYIATTFEHDGAEYVSTIAPMATATHPWIIGVYAPKDDFIGAIKRDRNRSIMIAIAVAAVTAAIGAWLANLIHKPVRALADRATRISRGRIVPAASLPSTFIELDRAVAAFNRMSIWLAGYREKNTELNESLRASSEALEARVKERTAELGQVNRRLHEEIAVRAATEKTLKDEAALHAHTSERLREAIEEARRANAAKSRFLSSMSHELR